MPKEGTAAQFLSAYCIIITKYHQKIISHSGGCLGTVTLQNNVKKMPK